MRIGIDAMGGDRPVSERVRGALDARAYLGADDRIVLVGQQEQILAELDSVAKDQWQSYIEVRHASEAVEMNESPVVALRTKQDSAMAVLTRMHRDRELDACISAGNTGAFVAAAQMNLRRLRGVHRPGIAIVTPTFHGPVAICDVGANVNCRPQHLHQYAIMASIYMETMLGTTQPRVGLLNIGEEEGKGNELAKRTTELLKLDPHINYIGNVEGKDLFQGACDVMICDGFVGNVVLKLIEGMAEGVIMGLVAELKKAMTQHLDVVRKAAHGIMAKYDFNEYGGAPLLGVNGVCIICHGASDSRGIKNAVRVAGEFVRGQVNQRITALLSTEEQKVIDG